MPSSFQLRFMRVGNIGNHPWGLPVQIPGSGGPVSIEQLFANASNNDILLAPDFQSAPGVALPTLDYLTAFDLHNCLQSLCRNVPGSLPVTKLGVLFAPRYAPHPTVLGFMFDTGFMDPEQANVGFAQLRTPREGCAVFVEEIRSRRPDDPAFVPKNAPFLSQLCFTLVHELAHVFNLQHTPQVGCFMDTSPAGLLPPPLGNFRFLNDDIARLSRCSHDPGIQPGASPFGSFGYFDSLPKSAFPPRPPTDGLTLRTRLSKNDCHAWEPIELEISLSVKRHSPIPSIHIPDEIDPGYSRFTLWIEEPSGARRRYRPTKHYCGDGSTFILKRGQTFRRDVSIFGESGGLTFRFPGEHLIWASLVMPDGTLLESKPIQLYIREELFKDKRAQRRHDEMRSLFREAAQAFFYRSGPMKKGPWEALEAIGRRARMQHLGSSADYALGRWLAHQLQRSNQPRKDWLKEATVYLDRASRSNALNPHRCKIAAGILSGGKQ